MRSAWMSSSASRASSTALSSCSLDSKWCSRPAGRDTGFLGDLRQRGVAPAVARQQPLGDREDPLLAVLALGEQRRVRTSAVGRSFDSTADTEPLRSTNLVNTQ